MTQKTATTCAGSDASQDWLNAFKFDDRGLIPAVTQDDQSGQVLMVAWMSRESIALSLETGFAVYWSRSRQALWKKGETSGHLQRIVEMRLDCDGDCILLKVQQQGGIACHTGRVSCFYLKLQHQTHAGLQSPWGLAQEKSHGATGAGKNLVWQVASKPRADGFQG